MGNATPTIPAPDALPGEEYTHRREFALGQGERQARRYERLARLRNFLLGTLVFAIWLGGKERVAVKLCLCVPPALLLEGANRWRRRVAQARQRSDQAANYYQTRLAFVEDRWAGMGSPGARFLDIDHLYAWDLDLFGNGSLFELLSSARTGTGEETLAGWLCAPASLDGVRERQIAVGELRDRPDLRERLALIEPGLGAGVDLQPLADWARAGATESLGWVRLLALCLAVLTVAAMFGWLLLDLGAGPFVGMVCLEAAFFWAMRRRIRGMFAPVEQRVAYLKLLAGIARHLESERFESPLLLRLQERISTSRVPRSCRFQELARLIDWLGRPRRDLPLTPLAPLLLWGTQFALAIEGWRRRHGSSLADGVMILGEFEALGSLAGYAYENPADPFPELIPEGPLFDSEGLGHPLLARDRCVRNDLRLGGEWQLLMVSGSNMSGKSTLLRSIGVNVVLALAGAPVRARRLRLSALSMGATLRVQDSLRDGRSRFYAEVRRLRQLVDQAKGTPPLLFLIDELLNGTNSTDRRAGAEAVVRALVNAGAIGLVTTHDLALTEIADLLAPRAANIHLEDHFKDGTLTFDYRLRPGVVQTRNALPLLRAVGIEI